MIKTVMLGVLGAGVCLLMLDYAFSIPQVHKSYASRECVKVENYPGLIFGKTAYSCESLPQTFDVIWVK